LINHTLIDHLLTKSVVGQLIYVHKTIGNASPLNCLCCYSDLQMHDRVRGQDIRLLQFFNITYIFDLMLEMKKVKFGMKFVPIITVLAVYRFFCFQMRRFVYSTLEIFLPIEKYFTAWDLWKTKVVIKTLHMQNL